MKKMVQNVINIEKEEDRILNIVKAKYGLKNKSEAVALIAKVYKESFLEPKLRPEYLKKLEKIRKGKFVKYKSVEEFRKAMEK